jgi:uncharacterized Zn finger protein
MTSIDDFLDEKTLMDLAPPNVFIDGAAAAEHGSVRLLQHDNVQLRGQIEDTKIFEAELRMKDGKLAWSCTCGEAAEHLCRHLVATALATWPEEPPDDVGAD